MRTRGHFAVVKLTVTSVVLQVLVISPLSWWPVTHSDEGVEFGINLCKVPQGTWLDTATPDLTVVPCLAALPGTCGHTSELFGLGPR